MTYFENLRVGERCELGSHTFTAEEIKAFAVRYDPQPFHVDEQAAARSPFGALVASGWHTASICIQLLVREHQRKDAEMRARGEPVAEWGPSPGIRDLKWLRPVYAGDTITFTSEIVELREMRSRPGWGLRFERNTGTNQNGEAVYSFTGCVFVERRPR